MFKPKTFLSVLAASLLAVFASQFNPLSDFAATVKVMPLGDSVTYGTLDTAGGKINLGVGGYRLPLFSQLTNEGYSVNFVGSVNGPAGYHEGHPNWRIDNLLGSIDGWLATYQPSIVMLMAGTNDLIQSYGVSTAISRMDTLLAKIFVDCPSAVVLLGTLWWVPTPNSYNYDINQINSFNSQLPGLVTKYAGQGRKIKLVDMYNLGWNSSYLSNDGLHPSSTGYANMAQQWHNAIVGYLTNVSAGEKIPR